MLSRYIIAVAALGLTTLASAQQPCGLKIAPCPYDQRCVPDSKDCTDLNRCKGTCQFKNKYTSCGGKRVHPVGCEANSECRDDPRLPESCGLACDIPGICMPKKPHQCAGFAGFACPKGQFCYDVPKDGCDPKNGGADCLGLCL
ncbi:proteinase inhibitor I1, Kazal [Metarhizium brunneum]